MGKKIGASTLLEVLVAMVVIMAVFAIAIQIFNKTISSSTSFRMIQVQQQLDLLAKQAQQLGYVKVWQLRVEEVDYHFKTDTASLPGYVKLYIQASQNHKVFGRVKCYVKERKKTLEN